MTEQTVRYHDQESQEPVDVLHARTSEGDAIQKTMNMVSTSAPLDLFFIQAVGAPTELVSSAVLNGTSVDVLSTAAITTGTYLGIFSGGTAGRFYFGESLGVPVGSTVLLDTPLDFAFDTAAPLIMATRDMQVDGSVTPQTFQISGAVADSPLVIGITRIMIQMETNLVPEYGKFGDIVGGLTKGLVLRRVDGTTRNIWNVKTNGEISNLTFDFDPLIAANPGIGINGLVARYTLAGEDKHNSLVKLKAGETLEVIVQDDLTDLLSFRMIAAGSEL